MLEPKTCIYAISLNEIKFVDRFVEYSKEADVVIICDTGSTDGTQEKFKNLGITVYNIAQDPWRFDYARNTALSLIPLDVDICLSLDIDECIQPGWSKTLKDYWKKNNGNITRIAYDYIWNWKNDLTPDIRFYADKIHHRKGYIWKHHCHETLYWVGQGKESKIVIPEISVHHKADINKDRSQYLDLLKKAVLEDPTSDRMAHYYARELMFSGEYLEAIKEFQRHLSLDTSTWSEERSSSMRYISRCFRYLKQSNDAIKWAIKSAIECFDTREPWLEIARSSYEIKDWTTCLWASTKCLQITHSNKTYMNDPNCWGWEPYDYAAVSAYNLGYYAQALEYGKLAANLNPDSRLLKNLEFYQEKCN